MKKRHTKNKAKFKAHRFPADTKSDWKRADVITYKKLEENATTDSSLTNERFCQVAKLIMPSNVAKERITIRIDGDVLEWLKKQGKGYQSKINSILRAFMKTDQKYHHGNHKHAHQHHHL